MKNRLFRVLILFIGGWLITAGNAEAQCSFTPTVSPDTIVMCPNSVDSIFTQTYDTYQWIKNGQPVAGATSRKLIVTDPGDYQVIVTLNGCTDTSAIVLVDSWSFAFPAISHSPQLDYCAGDSTVLSNAFGSFGAYQWYDNGVPITGATKASFTAYSTGSYTLTVYPHECPNYGISSGVPVNMIFHQPPSPVITSAGNILTTSGSQFYQWQLNGQNIQGASGSSYTATASGTYTVIAIDGNGCQSTSAPFQFTFTSAAELLPGSGITVQQDAAARFILISNKDRQLINQCALFDVTGRIMRLNPGSTADLSIPVSELVPGIYILQLTVNGKNFNGRLIIP